MSLFKWLQLRRPPDRAAAWVCLVVNQFMTPGLGSLGVGRRIAGTVQLTLALVGFFMVVIWMANMVGATLRGATAGEALDVRPWLWKAGLGLLAAGWCLALVTSLQVLLETRDQPNSRPPALPPPL
jgi:hypothetical protein